MTVAHDTIVDVQSSSTFWPNIGSWRTYFSERFPIPTVLLLSGVVTLGTFGAVQSAQSKGPLTLDLPTLGSALLCFLFLFHLRVLVEHRDYERDCELHPERPVQRGIMSLARLRFAAGLAIGCEATIAATGSVASLIGFSIALSYSWFASSGFLANRWLGTKILANGIAQTAVLPLLVCCLALRSGASVADPQLWLLSALSLCSFLACEVARKTRAPRSESERYESYSKIVGTDLACAFVAILVALSTCLTCLLGANAHAPAVWVVLTAAVAVPVIFTFVLFGLRPVTGRERLLEVVAAGHLFVCFGALFVVALQHGVRWS